MATQHIVNVSGGKDSDCCYLLALERGRPFRAVFADTGHEHPWTYDHIQTLASRTGGPEVEWIKEDFTAALERRRARLPEQWSAVGVSQALIDRALEILHPTGVPYLDMVLSKGMFAASVSRKFCTELLKVKPSEDQVTAPLLESGVNVVQWLGIRADESAGRADVTKHPPVERRRWKPLRFRGANLILYRPILTWDIDGVVDFHRRHGLPLNPLYGEGFNRVGCFPCINERKEGLAIIARRFPEAFDKLRAWEALCTEVNVSRRKAGNADICTFFASGKVPGRDRNTVDDVAEWALTSRGGKQYDMFSGMLADEGHFACAAGMGWCEEAA
jgi:3'-phosphoadenosine 5'-phosphosulfate sulfotransferase (PAPS reductase)/FAD synthetase